MQLTHTQYRYLSCHNYIGVNSFTIYDARLGSSLTSRAASGRVEVLTQRGWMPVCAYSWDASDSGVLCRQLGYDYSSYSEKSIAITILCT